MDVLIIHYVKKLSKLIEIKLLKEWKTKRIGDTIRVNNKAASEWVAQGYAEYITPQKQPLTQLQSIIKKYSTSISNIKSGIKAIYSDKCADPKMIENFSLTYESFENDEDRASFCSLRLKKDCDFEMSADEIKKLAKQLPDAVKVKEKEDHVEQLIKKVEQKERIDNPDSLFKNNILTLLLLKQTDEATEKIVEKFMSNNIVYTTRDDERAEMWIYREGIYIPQAKTYIEEFTREILGVCYKGTLVNRVVEKIVSDTYIAQEDFFINEDIYKVCIENGILNILTRELEPFDPKYFFFNKLPVEYKKGVDCPTIKKHFEVVLKKPEEDVPVMQEIFGYLLLKEYRIEKAFMFLGSGRNGKGKTLGLMERLLGKVNCANIPINQFERDQYAIGELFNKMANLGGDISTDALKDTSLFKGITGRDLQSAPRKYKTRVNFVNYSKQIFCANNLPRSYDDTDAFMARWVWLDFPFTFFSKEDYDGLTEQQKKEEKAKLADPDIITKLSTPEELTGLLNWALDGLDRLLKNENFSNALSINVMREQWTRKSDSFKAFFMDCCKEDYEGKVPKTDMRKIYAIYCKKEKLKPVSDKAIKYTLEHMGITEDRDKSKNGMGYYWDGVSLAKGYEGYLSYGISESPRENNPMEKVKYPRNPRNPSPKNETSDDKDTNTNLSEFHEKQRLKVNDNSTINTILEYIKAHPNNNALYLDEKYPTEIKQMRSKGDIYESESGTYKIM